MTRFYLREASITVVPRVGAAKTISNLRIEFEVEKTNESNPNTATIKVYNLSESTRSSLEGKNIKITLTAGYKGSTELLFIGDITKVVHDQNNNVDIVTTIEAGDGNNRYRTARIDHSFPPGASTQQVVEALVQALAVTRGPIIGVPNKKYEHGISLSGLVNGQLDQICQKNELEWSIQNDAVQIYPKKSPTLQPPVRLNSSTGLIGKPNKTDEGVEFKCLLNPKIKPGCIVILDSKSIKGSFKARKVKHNGDSQGGDFLSEIEATM